MNKTSNTHRTLALANVIHKRTHTQTDMIHTKTARGRIRLLTLGK